MKRLLLAALATVPTVATAQTRLDLRVESVTANRTSGAEAAVGMRKPLGLYVRVEASVGGVIFESAAKLPSPRSEFVARFLLDPLSEQRWGLSFGGGLGYVDRPYMLVVADLEGQPMGGWRPAVRVALGGGTRFGLVLRRMASKNRR